jgi:hypothetical protein
VTVAAKPKNKFGDSGNVVREIVRLFPKVESPVRNLDSKLKLPIHPILLSVITVI